MLLSLLCCMTVKANHILTSLLTIVHTYIPKSTAETHFVVCVGADVLKK